MVVGKDKKKQFDILKKLMNAPDVTEVVNACDAGREGELIFRSVFELAGCQKPCGIDPYQPVGLGTAESSIPKSIIIYTWAQVCKALPLAESSIEEIQSLFIGFWQPASS